MGLFHFGLCDIICLGARCGGFVRCHCLGWTTFPRIPFPVCFWSGQATREVFLQYLGDRSWMAAICSSLISLTLLTHLIGLRQNQAGCCSPFPESPFSFSDFWARGVRLVYWWKALVSTRCAYHQSQRKREWTRVLVCSHGLQVLLVFPHVISTFPSRCIPCELQAPAPDIKARTLASSYDCQVPIKYIYVCVCVKYIYVCVYICIYTYTHIYSPYNTPRQ